MTTAMTLWTGDTRSDAYNFLQPFVKLTLTVGLTGLAVFKLMNLSQHSNPSTAQLTSLGIVGGTTAVGLTALQLYDHRQTGRWNDSKNFSVMNTRLHKLGFIPVTRGLEFVAWLAFIGPLIGVRAPVLPGWAPFAAGIVTMVVSFYLIVNAYGHSEKLVTADGTKGTVCIRALIGFRGFDYINEKHYCG